MRNQGKLPMHLGKRGYADLADQTDLTDRSRWRLYPSGVVLIIWGRVNHAILSV